MIKNQLFLYGKCILRCAARTENMKTPQREVISRFCIGKTFVLKNFPTQTLSLTPAAASIISFSKPLISHGGFQGAGASMHWAGGEVHPGHITGCCNNSCTAEEKSAPGSFFASCGGLLHDKNTLKTKKMGIYAHKNTEQGW